MKPPICEVCNVRFRPRDGALISCVSSRPAGARSREGATKSLPGHPDNKGWFCAEHRGEAEKLSVLLTLPQVIASIRGETLPGMPAPTETADWIEPTSKPRRSSRNEKLVDGNRICHICGITFQEDTAGRISFMTTAQGAEWRGEMLRGAVNGTNPDHAWLCARHITPALRLSSAMTRSEAMAELMPAGREPLEYDERPPSVDPNAPFPGRTSFRPVTNGGLDGATDEWLSIAPQTPNVVHAAVHGERQRFGDALGVGDLRNNGRTSSASSDPADTRWAGPGVWVGAGYAAHQAGDVVVFITWQTFREGDRRGPIVQQGLRVLVQRREQSIFELTFAPADPPMVAIDDLVMLERVLVRESPLLDAQTGQALRGVVRQLVATLAVEPENPLSLEPDLVGVDLGTGKVTRQFSGRGSTVLWPDAGETLSDTLATIFDALPMVFEELGLGEVPDLNQTSERKWNPMDHSQPPHCPYSDQTRWSGGTKNADVTIRHDATHWNEHSKANESASVLIQADGLASPLQFSATDPCDGSRVSLALRRPTSAAIVSMIRSMFDC